MGLFVAFIFHLRLPEFKLNKEQKLEVRGSTSLSDLPELQEEADSIFSYTSVLRIMCFGDPGGHIYAKGNEVFTICYPCWTLNSDHLSMQISQNCRGGKWPLEIIESSLLLMQLPYGSLPRKASRHFLSVSREGNNACKQSSLGAKIKLWENS